MALFMASRLQAYTKFLDGLPTSLTQSNLQSQMTKLYAEILRFLALAIRLSQQPILRRALGAFWQLSDVQNFEQRCSKIAYQVEIEASCCDRDLNERDRSSIAQMRQSMDKVLGELKRGHQLQTALHRIETKIDLDKLRYAEGASFDASGQIHRPCHPETRVDLLREIYAWAQDPQSKSIFWLCGMAGTGKSTISMTFAQRLTDGARSSIATLGASFFFKRGEGDRGYASRLISTIVRQLVTKIPGLDTAVAAALATNTDICDKGLAQQFRTLLAEPLQQITSVTNNVQVYVVVIDALDECEGEDDVQTLLKLWLTLPQVLHAHLKLFLTSRPERPIQLSFKKVDGSCHQDMILHEVPQSIVRQDIRILFESEFAQIRDEHDEEEDWPGNDILSILTDMAVPLFIVAVTICRFIRTTVMDPQEQLNRILQMQGTGQLSHMRQMYMPVLDQWKALTGDDSHESEVYEDFRSIVGTIVTLAEPLSIVPIATLIQKGTRIIQARLRPLHSVLQIPTQSSAPVRPLHLSFREFLTGKELQNQPFGIDPAARHGMLLTQCLKILSNSGGLHGNMCNLPYPGYLRQDVAFQTVEQCLSPPIQYACRYWVHHAQHSESNIKDNNIIHAFLKDHFLYWLEALSFLGRLSDAIQCIGMLKSKTNPDEESDLAAFLEDARRFVLAHRSIIDLAPLQLYSSAVIFSPYQSIVRNISAKVPVWIQKHPRLQMEWGLELQKLEGHTSQVEAVTFSHDSRLLASASDDKTIRLWDPSTGQTVQTLEGHTRSVNAVTFSHDSKLLASGSGDKTIRLWDPSTGQMVQTLEGHTLWVSAVTFSHDSRLIASTSGDKTIRLWDPSTGQTVQTLEGHTSWVSAVSFSHDSRLLASASDDKTIRLWDPSTGQTVRTLEGHTRSVKAVTFSHDSRLLASASEDETIRLWDPSTGQTVQRLKMIKHTNSVHFAKNDTLLLTDEESFVIDSSLSAISPKGLHANENDNIQVISGWVQKGDQRLLWLPLEYREACRAVSGELLAFGLRSGLVGFLQIKYP